MRKQRVFLYLSDKEFEALKKVADEEMRDFRKEAAWLIRCELIRRGLIIENEVDKELAR
jgi:hypothetical protein